MKRKNDISGNRMKGLLGGRYPILANVLMIVAVAVLGVLIVYFSLAIFTKHGQSATVPGVENISYTEAVERLHDAGFRVEIRDSLYHDDVRRGYVIEQFPKRGSIAKPGRKVFLYINAVHPKEVVIDDEDRIGVNAMRDLGYRQGLAHLQELGFKNIKIVRILGDKKDLIAKVLADGRIVKKRQKVSVSSHIVIEVYDGRLSLLYDSLFNLEMQREQLLHPSYMPSVSPVYSDPGYAPATITEEEEVPSTYQYEEPAQTQPTQQPAEEPEPETIGL